MELTDKIREYLDENMSEKRKRHTLGVLETAVKMAEHYGEDAKKAEIAALCHDLFRGIHGDDINAYVKEAGLDDKYLSSPNLAHGKIAAAGIGEMFGITDSDIINAVSYHTTGRAEMSRLEMIIYIADMIEPNRDYPSVAALRSVAFDGLEEAMFICLKQSMDFLRATDTPIDEDSIRAYEWLKERRQS